MGFGSGFGVQGSWFMVQDSGFWVSSAGAHIGLGAQNGHDPEEGGDDLEKELDVHFGGGLV